MSERTKVPQILKVLEMIPIVSMLSTLLTTDDLQNEILVIAIELISSDLLLIKRNFKNK